MSIANRNNLSYGQELIERWRAVVGARLQLGAGRTGAGVKKLRDPLLRSITARTSNAPPATTERIAKARSVSERLDSLKPNVQRSHWQRKRKQIELQICKCIRKYMQI